MNTTDACDTHMHFYDARYPSAPDAVLHPPDATADDYRALQTELGLERVVVVQPTTYGLDNSCQLEAMATFGDPGDGLARGVMVVDGSVSADELRRMTKLGVRGARFHMLPGGAIPWEMLEAVAAKIAPFGWHIQLQCNGRELAARHDQLAALPTEIVIDHIGRYMPPVSTDDDSFTALLRLVEAGHAWVKLSAPYESSTEPILNDDGAETNHADVLPLIDVLVERVADRLLWATNWPHPGQSPAPSPGTLKTQLEQWLPTDELRHQVLVTNPDHLYFC
jgi:D-galactarolactone isomerase